MFNKAKKLTKEVWWYLVISGIVAIVFGFLALFWPALTAATLVSLVAIFTVIGGIVGLVHALAGINKDSLWWLSLIMSLISLGVGVFLVRNPLVTAALLVIILAAVVFMQAIYNLVIASYATKDEGRWMWIITGLLGIVVAIVIMVYPVTASLAFVWVLGVFALIQGVVNIAYAVQIRKDLKVLTNIFKN